MDAKKATEKSDAEQCWDAIERGEAVRRQLDRALRHVGLTSTGYRILEAVLERPDGLSVTCISDVLGGIRDSTRLVDRLEREGFIVRQRSAQDRRVVQVRLTDRGVDALSNARTTLEAEYPTAAELVG